MGGGKRLPYEEEVRLGLVKEEVPVSPEAVSIPTEPIEIIKTVVLEKEKKIKKPIKKTKKVIKRRK